jgi:hypothetical protein
MKEGEKREKTGPKQGGNIASFRPLSGPIRTSDMMRYFLVIFRHMFRRRTEK